MNKSLVPTKTAIEKEIEAQLAQFGVQANDSSSFEKLSSDAKHSILLFLNNKANNSNHEAQKLIYLEKAVKLGEPVFNLLSSKSKNLIIIYCNNLGVGYENNPMYYKKGAILGESIFNELDISGKGSFIFCCLNVANLTKKSVFYRTCIKLSESFFNELDIRAKGAFLLCLNNLGNALNDPTEKLKYFEKAIKLGIPIFDTLAIVGKSSIIFSLVNTGNTLIETNPRKLVYFKKAVSLGKPIFNVIDINTQNSVINAANNASYITKNFAEKLAYRIEVIKLGEPIFNEADNSTKTSVISSYNNLGTDTKSPNEKLQYFKRGIRLGEPVFDSLNELEKGSVIMLYANLISMSSFSSDEAKYSALFLINAFPITYDKSYARASSTVLKELDAKLTLENNTARLLIFPYKLCLKKLPLPNIKQPEIQILLSQLSRVLVSQEWQIHSLNLLKQLPDLRHQLVKTSSKCPYSEQPLLTDWLQNYSQCLSHSLTEHFTADTLPAVTLSYLALCEANSSQMLFSELITKYFQYQHAEHDALIEQLLVMDWHGFYQTQCNEDMRFQLVTDIICCQAEDDLTADEWLNSWDLSNGDAAKREWCQTLINCLHLLPWEALSDTFNVHVQPILAIQKRQPATDLIDFLRAWCNGKDYFTDWLNQQLQHYAELSQQPQTSDSYSLAWFDDLLERLPLSQPNLKLLETLMMGQPASIDLIVEQLAVDTDNHSSVIQSDSPYHRLWQHLELARNGINLKDLAESTIELPTLEPAESKSLADTLKRQVDIVANYQTFLQQPPAEKAKDVFHSRIEQEIKTKGHSDYFDPYLTAKELKRILVDQRNLGFQPKMPYNVSQYLRRKEVLLQLWFSPAGELNALWLNKNTLHHQPLPATFNLENWSINDNHGQRHHLFNVWQDALAITPEALHTTNSEKNLIAEHLAMVSELLYHPSTSPLINLLQWLVDNCPVGSFKHLLLITDSRLAVLPWHGIHQQVSDRFSLTLIPSASTWFRQQAENTTVLQTLPQLQVLCSADIYQDYEQSRQITDTCSQLEINLLTKHQNEKHKTSKTVYRVAELVTALNQPKEHHIICHGNYDKELPQDSWLQLHTKQIGTSTPSIANAWLLSQSQIKGNVFLSACQSLMQGKKTDDNRDYFTDFMGINGIGASFYAGGAQSVTGNSFQTSMIASVIFSYWFYHYRQKYRASVALVKTQQKMPTISKNEVIDILRSAESSPPQSSDSDVLSALVELLDGDKPFSHPYYWIGYSLLGDSPALKATKQVPWWLWWRRLLIQK